MRVKSQTRFQLIWPDRFRVPRIRHVRDRHKVTSLKALQQTAASIIKVREGKRKGLEAERKERVAAETERLKEGQKERKERNEY